MKIVTPIQMAKLEGDSAAFGITTDDLMENAGLAIATEIRTLQQGIAGRRVLVLVGPGNNGGDGLVAARHLVRWGAATHVYLTAKRSEDDANLQRAMREGARVFDASTDNHNEHLNDLLSSSNLVIDAVLGTGRSRPISGPLAEVMARVSQVATLPRAKRPIYVAIDVPTGVDAASGHADPLTPPADLTLALGFPKVGHFEFPAASLIGALKTLDIGIPPQLSEDIQLNLITPSWVRQQLPPRPKDGHKGTYGHALIIGGSTNYPGAPLLAAGAALRSGPGLVTVAVPYSISQVAAVKLTEAIQLPLPDSGMGTLHIQALATIRQSLPEYTSIAIGCGIGRSGPVKQFLETFLLSERAPTQPTVIDADALNILAGTPNWWQRIPSPSVLTPHPGEMSRLTGLPTQEIQSRRTETARRFVDTWGHVVVLKGAHTVVAQPNGPSHISPFTNALLSVGGTGDVLAGIIAGLLAQGIPPATAAACGVYLHGAAAKSLRTTHSDRGATAGDIINSLPAAIRTLLS